MGRLTKVIDALNQETIYRYDEVGNRIEQEDTNNHVTSFEYDELGRETKRTLPDGTFETKAYDATGNLKTWTKFDGNAITFDYDVNNRLTRRNFPDTSFVEFTYTNTGRRETATDSRGVTNYAYDDRDRLETLTYPDGRKLEYGYDGNGNRTSLIATMETTVLTTAFSYDDASRLDIVADPNAGQYDFDWDPNGNRDSLSHPNATATSYGYDTLNRLTDLTTTGPSGVIQSYDFTLGLAGNRERIDEADGTFREYTYDDLYRLTGDKVSDTTGLVYEKVFDYDPVGNRDVQTTTGLGAGVVNYAYDDRDRLLTENGTVYSYDDNGNLTSKSTEATYFWDFEDRLVRVEKADGTVVTHAYDADGNRVRTEITPATGPPSVTNFLVDPSGFLSHVAAETDNAGNLIAYYVRGVDDLLAVTRPTETRFYHADGLGSIRFLTDEVGNVTDSYTYTAFGEQLDHVGIDPQPYQFAGEPFDPNVGFSYNRARWLDPRVGRFVSLDPFEGVLQDPLSLHKYLYAHADPVNNLDPTGKQITVAEANLAVVFVVALAATAVLRTAVLETLEAPLGPSIAISEVYKAFQDVARDTGDVIFLALPEAIRQTSQRVRETLERVRRHIKDYQLVIQLPTSRKPGKSSLTRRGTGRFILFERGGDKQRIFGVRLGHRILRLNSLIIRFDWHPVTRVFPKHNVTVHFHVPPDEDIHHFLFPKRLTTK